MADEYRNYKTSELLDMNSLSKLEDNISLKNNPSLWVIWDFEKNNKSIWNHKRQSSDRLWGYCLTCKKSFLRLMREPIKITECADCKSLRVKYPEIYSQIHPTKNKSLLDKESITYGSKRILWWIGECGHEWECSVKRRSRGENCPYCAPNPKVLKGFNDIWTTNPNLGGKLLNKEDGYKYLQNSNVKTDWICPKCKLIIRNKQIAKVNVYGLTCGRCSDGFSFSEKVMNSVLTQLKLNYTFEKSFSWSNRKRYDFYLEDYYIIIETHGIQHFNKNIYRGRKRTAEEEIDNDIYKKELAINNGIKEYIVIDCRYSEIDYIKNNILNSILGELFDLSNIDWQAALLETENSYMIKCLDLWNEGYKSVTEIKNITGLSESTVRKYLKLLTSEGLCNYYTKTDLLKLNKKKGA